MIEKREHVRKLLATEASIVDDSDEIWRPIKLFDISKSGLAFLIQEDIPLNTVHHFSFYLPDSTRQINCVAIALHSAPVASTGGFRIGARFIGIDEEDVSLIRDYVEDVSGR